MINYSPKLKTFFCIVVLICSLSPILQAQYTSFPPINPDNIQIARDEYGVPHIFAKTDAEVAYGLAWANAEDAFEYMQEMMLNTAGKMGRVTGKAGAPVDYFVHAIGAKETAQKAMNELSSDYLKYIDGYCQGINAFAKKYPKRVTSKKLLPIKPVNVVQGYLVTFAALNDVAGAVSKAVTGEYDNALPYGVGSNAYAMNSSITKNGMTYLCTNPHFQLEGPFSFYEVHLHSEEGLNITGAIFQGGTSVFMGNNEHLGWGKTWNHFDGVDAYRLKMHPSKKLRYEMDGEWKKLEKRPVWLKVKVGPIVIPVRKVTYWSDHGPVFKSPEGHFHAVRSPSIMHAGAGQQYYEMNKAQTFEEFKTAVATQKIGKFNIVYADRYDNLYYLFNGHIPVRDASANWEEVQPGNTSKNLWTKWYTMDELPQVENPNCGYIFNMNNTPYNATCEAENPTERLVPEDFIKSKGNSNRATRFMELLTQKEHYSFKDFKALKFDSQYPDDSKFLQSIATLYNLKPTEHKDLGDAIEVLQNWDKKAHAESEGATMTMLTLNYVFEKQGHLDGPFFTGLEADEKTYLEGLKHAKKHLMKYFGTVKVPLKKVQRFVRHDKDYAVNGFADVLMAQYAKPYKDGKYKLIYGDSYTHFVAFSKDGPQKIETLLPFSTHQAAADYTDQIPMYNKHEMKVMSLDKELVLKQAVKVYAPK